MKQVNVLNLTTWDDVFQSSRLNEDIPVRVFKETSIPPSAPILLYFHGGMFNSGTLQSASHFTEVLSKNAIIVCIGYPLAPRVRFPETTEVAYEALRWTAASVRSLGASAQRIYVGGEHAGGNLAAATALIARDRSALKELPFSIAGQVLISPLLDPNQTSSSMCRSAEQPCREGWSAYLPHPADAAHPYVAPFYSKRLGNLPSTLIISAEYDPLRDEAEAYALALAKSGNKVKNQRFEKVEGNFTHPSHPKFGELICVVSDFLTQPVIHTGVKKTC